jgi:molybdenum cofactor cytidylyltransferase
MISAVVLAAGSAEQAGQSLFALLQGKPLLQRVLEDVLSSSVAEAICVVRNLAGVRANIAIDDSRLSWLVNYGIDAGQSSSLIAGLWAVRRQSEGALFLFGDQPLLRNELIDAVIDRFARSPALIIAPLIQSQVAYPVLFRRELFSELLNLKGNEGALEYATKNRGLLELVEWNDAPPSINRAREEEHQRRKVPA